MWGRGLWIGHLGLECTCGLRPPPHADAAGSPGSGSPFRLCGCQGQHRRPATSAEPGPRGELLQRTRLLSGPQSGVRPSRGFCPQHDGLTRLFGEFAKMDRAAPRAGAPLLGSRRAVCRSSEQAAPWARFHGEGPAAQPGNRAQ